MRNKLRAFLVLSFVLIPTSVFSASLKGSPESLRKQNEVADQEGLKRIKNDRELEEMKKKGELVPVPLSTKVDPKLHPKWRWCLSCTADFLDDFAVDFIDRFGYMPQLSSAVRTVERQLAIQRGDELTPKNANAAPVKGDRASVHLTGSSFDISKLKMPKDEILWVRQRLLELEERGLIEATEEWDQACFHVMVFQTYCKRLYAQNNP